MVLSRAIKGFLTRRPIGIFLKIVVKTFIVGLTEPFLEEPLQVLPKLQLTNTFLYQRGVLKPGPSSAVLHKR